MSKIDIDKFVCSMVKHYRDLTNADPNITRTIFDDCLQDQNLEYKDGKIMETLGKHGGISPNWKIEAGKWYMCIKDGVFGGYPDGDTQFHQGEVYLADDRGIMDPHNNNFHEDFELEPEGTLYEYFRPATEEEIPDPREYVLKELLDADTIYQMAMNDEMVQEAKGKAVKAISKLPIGEIIYIANTEETQHRLKFKEGDWVVATGEVVYRILKAEVSGVILVDTEGGGNTFDVSVLDDARLWTIQDAKEGDILTSKYKDTVLIFFRLTGDTFISHCQTDGNNFYASALLNDRWISDSFVPATKDQRDFLFSKMKEAGYEWDAEKKELRKIEKPDTIRFTDRENLINCLGVAPTGNPKTIRELLREFFETFSILLSDRDAVYTKAELLSRYKKYEEAIMSVACKQIASEIDVNEMLKFYKGTFTSRRIYSEDVYKEGIEDTIKKIKEI